MLDLLRSRPPSQEIMLLDYVKRLGKLRKGRIGVHIHFSHLAAMFRREPYIRIASEIFTTCVSAFEGQLHRLDNHDLIFIAKDASIDALDNAVNRLRVLFSEDPLAQFHSDTNGPSLFCTWYNLETDYDALLGTAEKILADAEAARAKPEVDPGAESSLLLSPIRPEILARLDQALEKTDVSSIARRQTVCLIMEDMAVQPLFEEIFVSIEDLQGVATPGVDLMANRWLFQYLTHTLDKRIMSMLIRDGVITARPFSLNLNVATILSPEFARFEAIITPQLRGRLVVEMNKLDVFSDMGAFLFARDYLHDRGFRICLDGLTHHTLAYYDRTRLGFDLIKIYWTPDSIDDMRPEMMNLVRERVMEAGQARTILCRCETARAIEIGQSLGVVMFQGRHVDGLLLSHQSRT